MAMNNTSSFVFDLEEIANKSKGITVEEKVEKPKKLKQIPDTRPRLAKTNRTVKCNFCEDDRILNPEQYQAYYDFYGDEDKIAREFICKPCEVKQKDNPFLFWAEHSPLVKKLSKNIKVAFELFQKSEKYNQDVLVLQNMINGFLTESKISTDKYEIVIERQSPVGLIIKNFPFVGTITLKPYEQIKINISE